MKGGLSILFLFSLLPNFASALSLNTHGALTSMALREFLQCTEGHPFFFEEVLIDSNMKEDTSLTKFLQYSHFYHPHHYVHADSPWPNPFDRCPSNYRVRHIEEVLEWNFLGLYSNNMMNLSWDGLCRPNVFYRYLSGDYSFYGERQERMQKLLGGAIHHLQDMVSPTHVVPIAHSLNDGFETYARREKREDMMREVEKFPNVCDFKELGPVSPSALLDEAAQKTLASLEREVPVLIVLPNGKMTPEVVTWRKWYGREDTLPRGAMEDYGPYGNNFGVPEFGGPGGTRVLVAMEVYDNFVRQQYRQAVEYSKRALYYFHIRNRETEGLFAQD